MAASPVAGGGIPIGRSQHSFKVHCRPQETIFIPTCMKFPHFMFSWPNVFDQKEDLITCASNK